MPNRKSLGFSVDTGQLEKLIMLKELTYKSVYCTELMESVSKDC